MFVALLTTTLFGSVVPNARTAAADEVGERTLQHAAASVEQAVPPVGANVAVERRVSLPGTIRGRGYRIEADGNALVLVHANQRVGGRTRSRSPTGCAPCGELDRRRRRRSRGATSGRRAGGRAHGGSA